MYIGQHDHRRFEAICRQRGREIEALTIQAAENHLQWQEFFELEGAVADIDRFDAKLQNQMPTIPTFYRVQQVTASNPNGERSRFLKRQPYHPGGTRVRFDTTRPPQPTAGGQLGELGAMEPPPPSSRSPVLPPGVPRPRPLSYYSPQGASTGKMLSERVRIFFVERMKSVLSSFLEWDRESASASGLSRSLRLPAAPSTQPPCPASCSASSVFTCSPEGGRVESLSPSPTRSFAFSRSRWEWRALS
jgi:hypothetical protein